MQISMRSLARRLTVAVTVALMVLGLSPPARADDYDPQYPPGCDRYVRNSWADTCWAGHNYVNYSTSVLGIQYILSYHGYPLGATDCRFGSRSDQATIRYQRDRGLTQDGIVGSASWGSLQGEIHFSGITDTYGSYYNNALDGLRFYWNVGFGGYWHVFDPYYQLGPPTYVAMSDADTYFCP